MPQLIHRHSEGIFIIAATPFCDNGSLDLASTDSMIEFYLESGVSGITILGIMGEAPKLGDIESRDFASHVIQRVDGRVPIVVGVSGAGLDNMVKLSHSAMDAGAAGVGGASMHLAGACALPQLPLVGEGGGARPPGLARACSPKA